MAKTTEVIDGVECGLETGTGVIAELDTSKRNWDVAFRADHTNLRKPVKGWLDPGPERDAPLAAVVEDAFANQRRVAYRIVIRRRAGQPDDIPFAEVPQFERLRDLVDVAVLDANGRPPASFDTAGTRSPSGAAPAPQPPAAAPEAQDEAPAPVDEPVDEPVGEPEAPPPPDDGAEPTAAAGGSTDGKRGPRIAEPKPWEPFQVLANGETTLNLGSYAVQAVEGMVLLAHDLLLAKAQLDARAEGKPIVPPTPARLRALAVRLLQASDRAQAAVRADGHFDRMSSSHTRARAAVRSALEVHPVPWDQAGDLEVLRAWVDDLAAYATAILTTVIGIIDPASVPTPAKDPDAD